ncbi:hypothetical protein SPAN111604_14330 [Sphingomonas antarctica]|uniref:hypothetical protein n=1 Tax=Sphingomonas antarctica TaxID=2040274 RepID=UPI0039EAD6D2
MGDVWNSVTVYGPALEIDRFKRLCIAPSETVFRSGQSGWEGCACTISVPSARTKDPSRSPSYYSDEVWNFQQFTRTSEVEYSFSFDTDGEFPVILFECLAASLPKLSFDCRCIASLDEFMGFGWFNGPPGSQDFRQDYEVPEDYWG